MANSTPQSLSPDLARPLHFHWPTLEGHAERIDPLYRALVESLRDMLIEKRVIEARTLKSVLNHK